MGDGIESTPARSLAGLPRPNPPSFSRSHYFPCEVGKLRCTECALTEGTDASNRMKRFLQLIERAHSTAHWGQLPAGGVSHPGGEVNRGIRSQLEQAAPQTLPLRTLPSPLPPSPHGAPRGHATRGPGPPPLARARKPSAKALPRVPYNGLECSGSRPVVGSPAACPPRCLQLPPPAGLRPREVSPTWESSSDATCADARRCDRTSEFVRSSVHANASSKSQYRGLLQYACQYDFNAHSGDVNANRSASALSWAGVERAR